MWCAVRLVRHLILSASIPLSAGCVCVCFSIFCYFFEKNSHPTHFPHILPHTQNAFQHIYKFLTPLFSKHQLSSPILQPPSLIPHFSATILHPHPPIHHPPTSTPTHSFTHPLTTTHPSTRHYPPSTIHPFISPLSTHPPGIISQAPSNHPPLISQTPPH